MYVLFIDYSKDEHGAYALINAYWVMRYAQDTLRLFRS
jgi:hypothetical protein